MEASLIIGSLILLAVAFGLKKRKEEKVRIASKKKDVGPTTPHMYNPMTESGRVRVEPVLRAIREKAEARAKLQQVEIKGNGADLEKH